MPKQPTPPITRVHIYGAMLLGATATVIVMVTLLRAGQVIAAVQWMGLVTALGCVQTVLAGCNQQFYFRHQRRRHKEDSRKARYDAVIAQAERYKREG
jgi:hypothetical protein